MSYESDFLEDNKKHGRSIISIGTPESGKSYLALKYVTYSLQNDLYDEYHIVAPTFNHEENSSYDFLKQHKDKVKIYLKYNAVVSERVDKAREKGKILFVVDDATSELLNNMDNTFIKLFTTTRHSKNGGLTLWIIVHSAKKVLPPMLRQNVKYVFLYRIESSELLEDTIFKEFLSLQYRRQGKKYDHFVEEFSEVMENNKFGVVLIARKIGIDFDVTHWQFLNAEEQIQMKGTKRIKEKPQVPNIDNNNIENQKHDKTFNPFKKIFFLKNI